MTPIPFTEATALFKGSDDGSIADLPVAESRHEELGTGFTSLWRLDQADVSLMMEALKRGDQVAVQLTIFMPRHPVVSLGVTSIHL